MEMKWLLTSAFTQMFGYSNHIDQTSNYVSTRNKIKVMKKEEFPSGFKFLFTNPNTTSLIMRSCMMTCSSNNMESPSKDLLKIRGSLQLNHFSGLISFRVCAFLRKANDEHEIEVA
ncbi:unnamed protein product [Brassica oleracea var. botrytis]